VVAEFKNNTGNPVFDEALRQGLASQLRQSPYLTLISDDRIRRTLQRMGTPADATLAPALAREVCQRAGGVAVLEGTISRLGSQFVLGLTARNCQTGDTIDQQQVQATREEDVLTAISRIAADFRLRAGESLAGLRQHSTPLPDATTSSLEALKA